MRKTILHSIAYTLMAIGALSIASIAVVAIAVEFYPDSRIAVRVVDAVVPDEKGALVPTEVGVAFRVALQSEVQEKIGTPIEGYEPYMFLEVFPGLAETDFEGVEASIGSYTVENGRIVHQIDPTRLIHSAAKAITDRGMDRLLLNVGQRLRVDVGTSGALTTIMQALVRAQ